MSLSTSADLQTQVANWLARSDLNSYIPDAITLFEASAARRLRVSAMETDATSTPTNGQASLPSDFLQMRRLTLLSTPNAELQYVAPQDFAQTFLSSDTSTPQQYTIEANTIKLKPVGDGTNNLELIYYAKTQAVSSTLNWLWTNHPDAYLFGTLCEMNFFNKGSALEMAQMWKQRRDEVFDEIQMQEFRSRPVGMMVRINGRTP